MRAIYEADDRKYIVWNREEFERWVDHGVAGNPEIRALALKDAEEIALKDAVVIRRQDLYASPALASYAASIAIAVKTTDDPKTKAQLQAVADYFMRQSELAADEGWKLPSP